MLDDINLIIAALIILRQYAHQKGNMYLKQLADDALKAVYRVKIELTKESIC